MKGLKGRRISDIFGKKTIITCLILLIIGLIIATIWLIGGAVEENKEQPIVYTESAHLDYKVYLKENDFFEQNYLGEDKQYIASIIDYIEAGFKYNLNSSEPNIKHKYKYKIVAETNVQDGSNKNSIYKFSEELLPETIKTFNSNKKLSINEKVEIDYNKYNNIIKKFIDVYRLNDIDSTLTIKMYVDVEGVTKSKAPVSSIVIPLTTKTVAIDIESNSVNATDISIYKEVANKNNLYIAILTSILTIMVIIELFIFMGSNKDDVSVYKNKIKKILMNYDSYIQKINNEFNFERYQKLECKSFEDLLQIRDTINEPILMLEDETTQETKFLIPSKGEIIYIYKLRLEDFKQDPKEEKDKSKGKRKK